MSIDCYVNYLNQMTGDEPGRSQLRNKFALSGHGLTEEELDDLMEEFIHDCKKQSDSFLKVIVSNQL